MHSFDLKNVPLNGKTLIEASAGTGKTYCLVGLYLRLLAEKNIEPAKIVAITFTQAATNELRERIWKALNGLKDAFLGKKVENDLILHLAAKYEADKDRVINLLNLAMNNFDGLPIHTIHGFCNKILSENPFDSGALFDFEIIPEEDKIISDIALNFIEKNIEPTSQYFCDFVTLTGNLSADVVSKFIKKVSGKPYLKLSPSAVNEQDITSAENEFRKIYDEAKKTFINEKSHIYDLLINSDALKRNLYAPDKIALWINELNSYFNSTVIIKVPKDLEKFKPEAILKGTLKNKTSPKHNFFNEAASLIEAKERLFASYAEISIDIKIKLYKYAQEELKNRKLQFGQYSYDDLLLNLYNALNSNKSNALVNYIKDRYSAILIDEFQDTDPVQFNIVNSIYKDSVDLVFLIGDPKQSVYGFRGADIFTYLNAAKSLTNRYTMTTNWRANKRLLNATNTFFSQSNNPFIYQDIQFAPTTSAKTDSEKLILDKKETSPLKIHVLKTENGEKLTNADNTAFAISSSVAAEIASLLNKSASGEAIIRPSVIASELRERGDLSFIEPNDIAILTRTNREALIIKKSLSKLNIPGIIYSPQSVFATDTASDLLYIIKAIASPTEQKFVKAALATKFLAKTASELFNNECLLTEYVEKFKKYSDSWQTNGFMYAILSFISNENIKEKIAQFENSQRILTDLIHLCELIDKESMLQKFSIHSTLQWLHKKRISKETKVEEYQLRLESDDEAVKIITIHKSKGLEFPIVFCPFNWKIKNIKDDESFIFHDKNGEITLDIGSLSSADNLKIAQDENFAEELRILYVCLTRAKACAYLYLPMFKSIHTSSINHILFGNAVPREVNDYDNKLNELTLCSNGDIEIKIIEEEKPILYKKPGKETTPLQNKEFQRKILKALSISSFSSMTGGKDEDAPDYDDIPSFDINAQNIVDPKFPIGAKPGVFFHSLLENFNFNPFLDNKLKELINKKIDEFSFDKKYSPYVAATIKNVLNTPLTSDKNFKLCNINGKNRLNEMEFYFPANNVTTELIKEAFAKTDFNESVKSLNFERFEGFLKGFIDMIFEYNGKYYIVDWKSNYLGESNKDYEADALLAAIKKEHYYLQYYIYTLALNKYLKTRKPEYDYDKDFGGIFYIFLRGVRPELGVAHGIFTDKPKFSVIESLASICHPER